jgi:cytosine/adenosine deaminase-related metal-dependent hydrolase
VVEQGIVNGTTAVRVFADVDTIGGTVPVQGCLELKRRFEGQTLMEVVAFPQEGTRFSAFWPLKKLVGAPETSKRCLLLPRGS